MEEEHKGILDSLSALAGTLVGLVYTRLELLSVDLEEDKQHWLCLLTLYLVALICFMLGIIFIAIFIVVTFWETHRLLVLGGLVVFFISMSLIAWLLAKRQAKRKPKLFLGSLLELLKDKEALDS
jgi:uncharacterized membrane protein YqjE